MRPNIIPRLSDANHLGFLISQVHHVEQQAYMIQYPDIQYRRLVPVDTSAASWARGITHFSTDKVGEAKPLNHMATDMPLVDLIRHKHEVTVEMAGIGYGYTIEELNQAMMVPGTNLTADGAAAAIRVSEEYVDETVLRGNPDQGWDGLINNTAIPRMDAPDGTATMGADSTWETKTPDEIIEDINSILTGIWTGSLTVELADTLAMSPEKLSFLANIRIPDGNDMTILRWIRENNLYTMQTGRPLMITFIRGLETAGTSNAERMIAYRNDPQVLRLHYPLPQRFDDPIRESWMKWVVPGYFRLGGLEIRRPMAVRYLDGI